MKTKRNRSALAPKPGSEAGVRTRKVQDIPFKTKAAQTDRTKKQLPKNPMGS